jgi:DNA (cytosine-5)-methyltransferase 1
MGYHRAGFDVVGVDIAPQPRYPFAFIQGDALNPPVDLRAFDVIHASPPCQAYSIGGSRWPDNEYMDLLDPTRRILIDSGKPYVIENVDRAPLNTCIVLAGTQFGLKVIRKRAFETSMLLFAPGPVVINGSPRTGEYVTVAGNGGDGSNKYSVWCDAMQIDWMTKTELRQAIPPAYTEWIGQQLIERVN